MYIFHYFQDLGGLGISNSKPTEVNGDTDTSPQLQAVSVSFPIVCWLTLSDVITN